MKLIARLLNTRRLCDCCSFLGYNMVKVIDDEGWTLRTLCWSCVEKLYKNEKVYQMRGGEDDGEVVYVRVIR